MAVLFKDGLPWGTAESEFSMASQESAFNRSHRDGPSACWEPPSSKLFNVDGKLLQKMFISAKGLLHSSFKMLLWVLSF